MNKLIQFLKRNIGNIIFTGIIYHAFLFHNPLGTLALTYIFAPYVILEALKPSKYIYVGVCIAHVLSIVVLLGCLL